MIPMFQKLIVELHSLCNRDCFFCPRHSDTSGHRKNANGTKVKRSMPSEMVHKILRDAEKLGFAGLVSFHHFSEPFLDQRLLDMAHLARKLGMRPYEHTNGDVLKRDEELCTAAREVFEYIVVGLYDHATPEQRHEAETFWRNRLGDKARFSVVDNVYPRSHFTDKNLDGFQARCGTRPAVKTYANSRCTAPVLRCMVHYTGNIALCCEDLKEEFGLGSAFDKELKELWYSSRHVEVIKDLRAGLRHKYELCRKCPIPPN